MFKKLYFAVIFALVYIACAVPSYAEFKAVAPGAASAITSLPVPISQGGTNATTANGGCGNLFQFPLSTGTYPPCLMTGTTTNAAYEIAGAILSSLAIGPDALSSQNSECYSIAIGNYALKTMSGCDGYYNQGGGVVGKGMHNIAIGPLAMYNLTAANSTAGSGDSGYAVCIGYACLFNATTWTGKIADTTCVGSNCLENVTTGVGNSALGGDIFGPTTGADNTFAGAGAGGTSMTTGTQNQVFGNGALAACVGCSYNTAIGVATMAADVSSNANVAIGNAALISLTTGLNGNVAVGNNSLQFSNSTSGQNTAMGYAAGQNITTGYQNVAIGYTAMIGSSTVPTTGTDNTAVGDTALNLLNGAASFNTAIGAYSGFLTVSCTTCTNSTFIGGGAHGSGAATANEIAIGYLAAGLGANQTVIGNSSTTGATIYGLPGYGFSYNNSGTTWTSPAYTTISTVFKVTTIGGGGTGGVGSGTTVSGGGGGSGGVCVRYYTGLAASTSYTYAVGAAGSSSTFSDGTTTLTAATGSNGGTNAVGGAVGACTNQTYLMGAQAGQSGPLVGGVASSAGLDGGGNPYGIGGKGVSSGNGTAGTGCGAGGSGAPNGSTGGAGATGCVIIEWTH